MVYNLSAKIHNGEIQKIVLRQKQTFGPIFCADLFMPSKTAQRRKRYAQIRGYVA